jgi:hypothetical protein
MCLRRPPAKIGTVTLVQVSLRRADVELSTGEFGGDADWHTRRRQRHQFWAAEPDWRATPRRCGTGGVGDKQSQTVERIHHAHQHLGHLCRVRRNDGVSTGRTISRRTYPTLVGPKGAVGSVIQRVRMFHERPQPNRRLCTMTAACCRARSRGSWIRVVVNRSPAGQGSEQAVHRPWQYRRMIAQARGFSDRLIGSRAMTRRMNSRRTGVGKFICETSAKVVGN